MEFWLSNGLDFSTEMEQNPWFQMEFQQPLEVVGVVVVQSMETDGGGKEFENVRLSVANNSMIAAEKGNQECAYYKGPSIAGRVDVVNCETIILGKYFILEKVLLEQIQSLLTFSEIVVHIK